MQETRTEYDQADNSARELIQRAKRVTRRRFTPEEKVRARSEELAELQAEAELERLKAQFISQVSHELRTPLGFIKGYVTTLLRPDVSPDDETRREFLTVIHEESQRLEALVEELLDTSRIRAGTFTVSKEEIDMEALFQRVLERAKTGMRSHTLTREGDMPLPTIRADVRRLEQVLDNLLDNATKYSAEGRVTVSAQVEDGKVHFTVSDQGDGIPAGELGRVFDAFYRGHHPAVRKVRGTGLGLTICKGIVEAHDGRIWAESTPGHGSRFHFTLPLSGEDEGQAGPHS